MKLGLSIWSYARAWKAGTLDVPAFIREAARLGADGVELLDAFWRNRPQEESAVRSALQETGLPVCAYSVSNDFVLSDRTAQLQIVTDGVDSAVQFGAPIVRVFAGNFTDGMDVNAALLSCVKGLSDAAAYAQAHGVTLALENHGRLAGRCDQIAYLLDAVNSPALRANVDTGNFLLVHEAPHGRSGSPCAPRRLRPPERLSAGNGRRPARHVCFNRWGALRGRSFRRR